MKIDAKGMKGMEVITAKLVMKPKQASPFSIQSNRSKINGLRNFESSFILHHKIISDHKVHNFLEVEVMSGRSASSSFHFAKGVLHSSGSFWLFPSSMST
ncbi:hypothetical protein HID58_013537 [Brassica napus]|uniref:Uncharacterized protein n=1 Tax=Brassica napus TaxID=3708 RepID=A0ABQ8E469_BRANA|nr:hypothetical protein HID58_013537 [Brassica napus]